MNAQDLIKPEEGVLATNQWLVFLKNIALAILSKRIRNLLSELENDRTHSRLAFQTEGVFISSPF
ncbi:MAG TPA: hypothetical protein VNX46_14865 [Candidatus Acidoferrum sp.]|jgi:hypothetical protein|nr:hypothetical protein [Candidatus Acidoferrum sp.]